MPDENMPIEPDEGDDIGQRRSRGPAINKVMLLGRLTRDPELYYTNDGRPIAQLRMATNDRDEAEYHSVTAFGKQADFAGEYLGTGRLVYVEGRLQTQSYFDKTTGEKKYSTKVLANSIQALDRPREVQQASEQTQQREPNNGREQPAASQAQPAPELAPGEAPF